jgi:hypothetical protein
MTFRGHIGPITKEEFMDMPEKNRWGVLFEILVAYKMDRKTERQEKEHEEITRCATCITVFDRKYEPKRSLAWRTGYLFLIAICSAVGGFVAHVVGFEPTITGKH